MRGEKSRQEIFAGSGRAKRGTLRQEVPSRGLVGKSQNIWRRQDPQDLETGSSHLRQRREQAANLGSSLGKRVHRDAFPGCADRRHHSGHAKCQQALCSVGGDSPGAGGCAGHGRGGAEIRRDWAAEQLGPGWVRSGRILWQQ